MNQQTTLYNRLWPRQFLADFERQGSALWFYLYLLTRMNPETGYFRSSFLRIAEDVGVSVVELKRWLEQLEEEGYVRDESLNSKLIVKIEL